ncbi:MAG: DUF983 domain-containing protein [Alphaproteobacteria bacterium]|jgi:uncharacterized protein (DUF983 family)|tara:strand:- start:7316 stop:7696 length:381 start_codon:yes stop_codon:yes gene_type:complete
MNNKYKYPNISIRRSILKGKCPRCGIGSLYRKFIILKDCCDNCKLTNSSIDPGDGASFFVILIAGVFIVGGALLLEVFVKPSYYIHAIIWFPLCFFLPLMILRQLKSALIFREYSIKKDFINSEEG